MPTIKWKQYDDFGFNRPVKTEVRSFATKEELDAFAEGLKKGPLFIEVI